MNDAMENEQEIVPEQAVSGQESTRSGGQTPDTESITASDGEKTTETATRPSGEKTPEETGPIPGSGDQETTQASTEPAAADQVPERNSEAMSILEAALFASTEILTAQRLKGILPGQPDARTIRSLVNAINAKLQRERHPFEIVEIGGGYQFRTVPYYQPWVQKVFKEKTARRLSIQALECLAIIAYRQPITRAEIEAIRGVTSDGAMATLLEKRLVTVTGRSDKPGRPLLYGTTPYFLQYFGLAKLSDLPRIEEFEAMAREKMEELTDEELRRLESMAGEEEQESSESEAEAATESTSGDGGEAPVPQVDTPGGESTDQPA